MADDDSPDDSEAVARPVDAPPNAADPTSHRRQRAKAKVREEEKRQFWRGVFASDIGRREMWDILQSGHAFDERFACGPNGFPQVEATWCEAGEQRLAFRLYRSWMRLDPDGVALMLIENDPGLAERRKERDAARR